MTDQDPRSTKPRTGVHRDPDLPSKPSAGIPRTPQLPGDVTEDDATAK